MAISRTTNHDSVPALGLLPDLVIGCETIQKGVAQLLPGNRNKISLRRFYATGENIEARTSTFAAGNIADAITKDEKQISLAELQQLDTVDPVDFNNDWPDLWTPATQGTPNINPQLSTAMRSALTRNFNNSLDKLLWQGDTAGAGMLALMDGFIKLIDADASVINVTPAGVITAANVIAVFEAVIQAGTAEMKELSMPSIVCGHKAKYLYRQAARALDYKGTNITEAIRDVYGGYPIISVNGIPDDRVFFFNAGGGDGAELKVGLWDDSDRFNIAFGKDHDLDDLVGVRIRFDCGVQHVYGKQIVEYSPV